VRTADARDGHKSIGARREATSSDAARESEAAGTELG
jgi:hypothetical protein